MAIQDLLNLIPPPTLPLPRFSASQLGDAQQQLGLLLPEDYLELIRHYGSGMFPGGLYLFNPFTSNQDDNIRFGAINLTHIIRDNVIEFGPFAYQFYPEIPGLLACGSTSYFRGVLFWLVSQSTPWNVVASGWNIETGDHKLFKCDLTTFLVQLYSQQIKIPFWGDVQDLGDLQFKPDLAG